ncbi:bifunctional pyr operon transcriptional regulator/uracil phosphoribosyltransferase PyrR [Chitinasiproducens palmae]|uniref:Pyrimidine operon attenuation protein / uracil phosphoribosyltransferase n=1 Tax=Chitinasiproducens palmae TaxID=1770053 RepID=A0A1H2PMP3_9BURK|nr:bifunctional pyr operon transcriptional regulator/uracil phosphoribosyltransferase PyrR [Chitinasiproducens palmae]SDV47851.1 pyrimidine operon attenuation protein / uracil phosphoribosyltransferase [Chitinasiproducens palmae]
MKTDLLDAEALYRTLFDQLRAAYGDALGRPDGVLPVGIVSGGAWLAERIARDVAAPGQAPLFGTVNIALHRDDFAEKGLQASPQPTSLPFAVGEQRLLLLDDVLFTGRTIRAALNELYDYGRPASVDLAVLADRGGRELPIGARFVGAEADVADDEILVLTRADDGRLAFETELRPAS